MPDIDMRLDHKTPAIEGPDKMQNDSHQQSVPLQELSPVSKAERIDVLDILRGFAIIGILLMNIEWFGRATREIGSFDNNLVGLDHAVGWLVRCFVEGKFYKLFALLFGMGFAIMLLRAREVGRPFTAWFIRRMLVLFVIGMLHMVFVWGGDILHDYAFAGLLFLCLVLLVSRPRFQRFDRPDFFLRLGLIWMVFPFLIATSLGIGFGAASDRHTIQSIWEEEQEVHAQFEVLQNAESTAETDDKNVDQDTGSGDQDEEELTPEELITKKAQEKFRDDKEDQESSDGENHVFSEGSYWQATEFRAVDALERIKFTPMFSLIILLPVFVLGYWLISSNVIRDHRQHELLFNSMAWIGMGVGLAITVAGLLILQHPATDDTTPLPGVGFMLFMSGQYLMTAGYLGVTIVLLRSARMLRILSKLVPLGRMALTNYLMQTVMLAIIFHGYGLGMYGKISRAPQMLIVIAIVVFQIYFSRWWLKNYRFGPLEWVWRSLSYKQVQPMRNAT